MINQPCVQVSIHKHSKHQANIVIDSSNCDGEAPYTFNSYIQYGTYLDETIFVKQIDSKMEVISINFKERLLKTYRISDDKPQGELLKNVINTR